MKRIINATLALILILSLSACSLTVEDAVKNDELGEVIPHTHIFGEWESISTSSCTECGEKIRSCECGEKENQVQPPLGHKFSEWITEKDATYTEPGIRVRSCFCGATESEVIDIRGPVFDENFDGTVLNGKYWSFAPEWIRHDGGSIWDNSMTSLDGEGHLVLRAQWDEANQRVSCGAIYSKGLFEYGYGYYEASIKFPVIKGVWGAFWINCGNISAVGNGAKDGVEIDVIESILNDEGYYNSALHWDGYGNMHQSVNSGRLSGINIYDGNFHLFAVDRSERGYIFYIDGIEIWRVYSYSCSPCPEPGFLELSLEGTYGVGVGTEESISALPVEMLVDYVRVYEANPYK